MLENTCYVSRGMDDRKVPKSKCDLKGHLQSELNQKIWEMCYELATLATTFDW